MRNNEKGTAAITRVENRLSTTFPINIPVAYRALCDTRTSRGPLLAVSLEHGRRSPSLTRARVILGLRMPYVAKLRDACLSLGWLYGQRLCGDVWVALAALALHPYLTVPSFTVPAVGARHKLGTRRDGPRSAGVAEQCSMHVPAVIMLQAILLCCR